jgi:CRISPR-associated endonuclease Csn1
MENLSLEGDSQEQDEYTLKKSEEKKSGPLVEYMKEHGLKTVGCAFAQLEDEGVRIRNSVYQAVRSQYKEEIDEIFKKQIDLADEKELLEKLLSEKKNEGSIFYKCPLKSQKHNVGYCTLESKKTRCPISHPAYEEFRAWSFINNIKYRTDANADWQILPLDVKNAMYVEKFCGRVKADFKFEELRTFIEQRLNVTLYHRPNEKTINYKDSQSVAGCPVIARLINLLGEDWESVTITGSKVRRKGDVDYKATYRAYDLWNICYNAEDPESLELFATRTLGWGKEKAKSLSRLWDSIQEGYAMLSLKALRNINYFLRRGLIYSDAVALAKIPECLGDVVFKEKVDDADGVLL